MQVRMARAVAKGVLQLSEVAKLSLQADREKLDLDENRERYKYASSWFDVEV